MLPIKEKIGPEKKDSNVMLYLLNLCAGILGCLSFYADRCDLRRGKISYKRKMIYWGL